MNGADRLDCEVPRGEYISVPPPPPPSHPHTPTHPHPHPHPNTPSCGLALVASRAQNRNRLLQSDTVINCTAPPYLSDLLQLYIPSCTLRSSAEYRIFSISNERRNFKDSALFLMVLRLKHSAFFCATCSNFVFLKVTAEDSHQNFVSYS